MTTKPVAAPGSTPPQPKVDTSKAQGTPSQQAPAQTKAAPAQQKWGVDGAVAKPTQDGLEGSAKRTSIAGLAALGAVGPATATPAATAKAVPTVGEYDYVIVGSGAGGAPLAAELARKGYRVCVLEAGSKGEDPASVIPTFHAISSETGLNPNKPTTGDAGKFFVTQDAKLDPRDPNFVKPGTANTQGRSGIDMPRGWGFGGSPQVNAMITKLPPPQEWQAIYEATGDPDWKPENMRKIWETAVEHNDSHPVLKALDSLGRAMHLKGLQNIQGHGFQGWLDVSEPGIASASAALKDKQLSKVFFETLKQSAGMGGVGTFLKRLVGGFDDNNTSLTSTAGFSVTPEAVHDGVRSDPGDHLLEVQKECELLRAKSGGKFQGSVDIKTGALATKIDFDQGNPPKATGVEFLAGDHLYQADNLYNPLAKGTPARVTAKNEVIVSAGTFNSPQLLMLSGIGPKKELEAAGIPVLKDRPGVGTNYQDRLEVGVVSQMKQPFSALKDTKFTADPRVDPTFKKWVEDNGGTYSTDGVACAVAFKSDPKLDKPDVYIFGVPGDFHGYYPGYSQDAGTHKDRFTWVVLDANQNNAKGTLTLDKGDPTKQPIVDKHSFDGAAAANNVEATAKAVEWVRKLNEKIGAESELVPGTEASRAAELEKAVQSLQASNPKDAALPGMQSQLEDLKKQAAEVSGLQGKIDAAQASNPKDPALPGLRKQLADVQHANLVEWVKENAWGHHPTGTCPMGTADDPNAVVDSNFNVIGTQGLRVVDQSAVKDIQGLFPVADLYVRSELASQKIIASAEKQGNLPPVGSGKDAPPLWGKDKAPSTSQQIAQTRAMYDAYFGNKDGIPNDDGPGKLWRIGDLASKVPILKDLPGIKEWNSPRMQAFQEALSSAVTITPAAEQAIPPSYRQFYKMMKADQAQLAGYPVDKISEGIVKADGITVTDPVTKQKHDVSHQLFYQRWDPPNGVAKKDVVVISPAYQATGRQWTEVAAELAKQGNTVLVMDNEYAGLSKGSPGKVSGDSLAAGVALMTSQAEQIRQSEGLGGKIRVLGESLSAGAAYSGILAAYNGDIDLKGRPLPKDNLYVGMINPYLGKLSDPALQDLAGAAERIGLPAVMLPTEASFTNVYKDADARKRFDQLAQLEDVQVSSGGLVDANTNLQHALQAVQDGTLKIPPNVSFGMLRTTHDQSVDRAQTDRLEKEAGKSIAYEKRIADLPDHALVLNSKVQNDIVALATAGQ